ncbi:MAG: HTH domain-containing protein [Marinoscillum sp.]
MRDEEDNDIKRISRLSSILTQLQTVRLLTAPNLAEKFDVSTRTIYRDIKALEQAGYLSLPKKERFTSYKYHLAVMSPDILTNRRQHSVPTP